MQILPKGTIILRKLDNSKYIILGCGLLGTPKAYYVKQLGKGLPKWYRYKELHEEVIKLDYSIIAYPRTYNVLFGGNDG